MPPKKADKGPSKKTEAKKKDKVIEDKTFGLKNKKGNKQQQFIAQVQKQVQSGGNPIRRKDEEARIAEKKAKEAAKKKEDEEKRLLNKVVVVQKVDQGVDPKSVFCAFFKQGLCKKGDKCKFSHDPSVEGKAAKRNLYADARDEENENMDEWDEEKLEEVVKKKHGAEKANATDIICKHFLDAVENGKYGWVWSCPNGGDKCMYRHALPPGFVLKKDKQKAEKKDQMSIEELIENRRAELSAKSDLTPVNLETFVKWKKRKLREKAEAVTKSDTKKKDNVKSGQTSGLSGRELFSFNPTMAGEEDDDEEGSAFDMTKREAEEDDGVKVHDIKFDAYGIMDDGVDESTDQQLAKLKPASQKSEANHTDGAKDVILNGVPVAGASGGVEETGPIDEDLFDDEDLDELEEDLENLEV